MPTIITDFSSAENFQTAWIYHSVESTNPDSASANSGVPAALSSVANNRDTWSLVINGQLIGQGLTPAASTVPYPTSIGGEYRLEDFLQEKVYFKEDTDSTTTTTTSPGEIEPSPAGGTLGHIIGILGQETTAWIEYNDSPTVGEVNPYWNGNGANNIASPATGKYGVIWDGIVVAQDETTYGTDLNGRSFYVDVLGRTYTRMQQKRIHPAGYNVYNVQRQLPDVTETITDTTVTRTSTIYKFYGVSEALASEINNFTVSAFIILPSHILQRSISTSDGQFLQDGLNMSDSHIRISSNRALAEVEISDLKINHGIEAQTFPVTLKIGTDNVVIALNQVTDVSLGAGSGDLAAGQVLQYDGDKWINAQTAVPSIGPEPSSPINGQLWFDDAISGKLYMWNINTWVQISS
tara:strand:- start:3721 stop:4944 length:1224 start_codon:yes stop_codon:yes gene_type:complete